MKISEGYIRLSRKFFNNSYWTQQRTFSFAEAWLDLIQMARFEVEPAQKILPNGKRIWINRGELHAGLRFLSSRWGWGTNCDKTKKFIDFHISKDEIVRRIEQGESLLCLCNYEKYNPVVSVCVTPFDDCNNLSISNMDIQTVTPPVTPPVTKNNKGNKENKENNNIPPIPPHEDVDEVYNAYPTKCIVKGRKTNKSFKDKEKIKKMLRTITKDNMLLTIKQYIDDCKKHKTYMQNFSTFLNNFPDYGNDDKQAVSNNASETASGIPPEPNIEDYPNDYEYRKDLKKYWITYGRTK